MLKTWIPEEIPEKEELKKRIKRSWREAVSAADEAERTQAACAGTF